MPLFTNVTIGDHHLSCLCSHQGVGKFRAALHALLIPPRPPKPTPTPAGPTAPTPPDDEPQFLGADDLGSLALAMMNNLSISSPLADLQDVGPSWSNPAEAPFYNPKPPADPTQRPTPPTAAATAANPGRVDDGGTVSGLASGWNDTLMNGALRDGVVQDPLLQALQQPPNAHVHNHVAGAAVPMAPPWDAVWSMSPPPGMVAQTHAGDAATPTDAGAVDFTPFFAESGAPGPQAQGRPVLVDSHSPSHSRPSYNVGMGSTSEPSPFALPPMSAVPRTTSIAYVSPLLVATPERVFVR